MYTYCWSFRTPTSVHLHPTLPHAHTHTHPSFSRLLFVTEFAAVHGDCYQVAQSRLPHLLCAAHHSDLSPAPAAAGRALLPAAETTVWPHLPTLLKHPPGVWTERRGGEGEGRGGEERGGEGRRGEGMKDGKGEE